MYRVVVLASEMYTHLVPDRRIRATIKPTLGERIRTNTLTASTDTFKVIETIDDRVGGYNFLPTLIEFGSRRKQCPLHSVNSESSLLGCAGSDHCSNRLVAALFEDSATQAKRLNQSRYGPVEPSWTRTMSIPFHCMGATTV